MTIRTGFTLTTANTFVYFMQTCLRRRARESAACSHVSPLLWGLVIVAKGSLTLWLLVSLSTVNFVLIRSSAIIGLTLLAAAATVGVSAIAGVAE